MAGELLLASPFLFAGLMFLLAGWLLWLNFASRINRSFAVFLCLRGLATVVNRLPDIVGDDLYWRRVGGYVFLALVPSLAYFLAVYARPRRAVVGRTIRWAILVAALGIQWAYFQDHCLDLCVGADDRLIAGPLAVLSFGVPVATGIVGLWLAIECARDPARPRRDAAFLVSAGFVLLTILDASVSVALVARNGSSGMLAAFAPNAWAPLAILAPVLGLPPALAALALYVRAARAEPAIAWRARRVLILAPLAAASGVFVGAPPPLPQGFQNAGLFLIGLWRILLPALVAYAIVRHQLFDLEVKIKWTIRRSVVAGAFLATFLIVSQLAQNYFTVEFGWVVGGLATGLLLFAVSPLQRMAQTVADAAMPGVHETILSGVKNRTAAFKLAVEMAYRDDVITRREERALARLADVLHLSAHAAFQLREEVEAERDRKPGTKGARASARRDAPGATEP